MSPSRTFTDFLADRLDGKRWCVAHRLTPRLQRQGYEITLSQKRIRELEIEWERETYGAPLATLRDAAPDMLKMLKWAKDQIPAGMHNSVGFAALIETIWAAEGRAGYADGAAGVSREWLDAPNHDNAKPRGARPVS